MTNQPEITLVTTADGSHSLYNNNLDETYHSRHGAVSESMHVFIDAGYRNAHPGGNEIKILEVGFGTGLNALLTCMEGSAGKVLIHYIAIEPFPVDDDTAESLNYADLVEVNETRRIFTQLHKSNWLYPSFITNYFILNKLNCELMEVELQPGIFDLVYFDAFSPEKQPEMWTPEVFSKIFAAMKTGGKLVTYCSKSSVRRTLTEAGFSVEKLPGPAGKREIIRATAL